MQHEDDKCIPQQKQRNISIPDRPQRSVPDGWPFRKTKDTIDARKAVKIDCDPFAEEYNMKHKRRGVAIILNHVEFDNMVTRKGSVKDAKDLGASLKKLGFDVRPHLNPAVKTITTVLQSTAAEDHTDADCLIVVAMSHGESGLLHSTDSLYPVDILWTPFTSDRCSSLAGKPKLFFIQACRGKQLDKGVNVIQVTANCYYETDSMGPSYKIPAYADIMVAYSTYDEQLLFGFPKEKLSPLVYPVVKVLDKNSCGKNLAHVVYAIYEEHVVRIYQEIDFSYIFLDGFYSWRNPDSGSWFIQALCEELELHGRSRDLLSLMTFVNRRVAIEYQSYVPENEKFHGKKQIPSIVSMLTRLVYFPDKHTSTPDDGGSKKKESEVHEKIT